MIEIIKELNIEVSKPNVFQAIVAKQYDMNTRFVKATFVDGGNKIFIDPNATVSVVINALRPDGESKGFDGEVNDDGTVTVPLHSWMLELVGTVTCDISVIDIETDDNKKLTTTSFTLFVEKAAYGGDGITNDPQYDVLVQLLESCSEAGALAQEALDKSNEANSKYDACVEATENANAAAEELGSIKEELAEGGYIHSIKEQNHGNILSFWVGTQEEYNALPEPPKNSYVIISDDNTFGDIMRQIEELQTKTDNFEDKRGKVLFDSESSETIPYGSGLSVTVGNLSNYHIVKVTTGCGYCICSCDVNENGHVRIMGASSWVMTADAFANITLVNIQGQTDASGNFIITDNKTVLLQNTGATEITQSTSTVSAMVFKIIGII